MLGDNKIWKSRFNPTSLEGEEWLDPSDNLFDAIEAAVYNEEPKKRKKPIFWIIFFTGLIIIFSVLVISLNKSSRINSNGNTSTSAVSQTSLNSLPTNALPKSSTSTIQSHAEKAKATSTKKEVKEVVNQLPMQKELFGQSRNNLKSSSTLSASEKKFSSPLKNNGSSISTTHNPLKLSQNASNLIEAPLQNKQTILSDLALSTFDKMEGNLFLKRLSLLPLHGGSILENNTEKPRIFLELEDNIKVYYSDVKSGLLVSIGQSYTQFNLSQSFDPLVAAADFRSSNGNGYNVSLGYEKSLSSRIELRGELSLSQTTFTSGHNSTYNYQQGPFNQVDLVMATPLGFMDGGVLISDTAGLNEDSDLVLDLFNHHRFRTLGVDLGIAYRLFEFGQLRVKLEGGLGVQQFFGFRNSLDEVISSNPNFSSSNTSIASTQQDINKLMGMATVGLRLEQSISASHSLLFRYQASKGLQNLHETVDYSTGLFRQNVSVGLKWHLK